MFRRSPPFRQTPHSLLARGLTLVLMMALGWPVEAAGDARGNASLQQDAGTFGREIRFGLAAHDVNGNGGREGGVDLSVELRGNRTTGAFWQFLLAPRPHVGVNVHSAFETSSLYAGLTWAFPLGDTWYLSADFGGAVHTGRLERTTSDRLALGSRLLFREAIEIGIHIGPRWRAGLRADHMSNAHLASPNDGLTTIGLMFSRDF